VATVKRDMLSYDDVLARFPAVRRLADSQPATWHFAETDFDGEPATVGHCHWSMCIDALGIFDAGRCVAVRILDDAPGAVGGLVWQYEGDLTSAVAALLVLPMPSGPATSQVAQVCSTVRRRCRE
jgi:hypothetical protein